MLLRTDIRMARIPLGALHEAVDANAQRSESGSSGS